MQTESEEHLIRLFQCANLCAIHGRRVTVQPKDYQLTRRISQDLKMLKD
jgi:histone H3